MSKDTIEVIAASNEHIEAIAKIHQMAFVRQSDSRQWIECNYRAFPRMMLFCAVKAEQVVGYIMWNQKSGFRQEVVLELEQLAVDPNEQGHGVGTRLIDRSLALVRNILAENGSRVKHIVVTTRADNQAQQLYKKTLGAQVEMTIRNLYSSDEVYMIARNVGG